MCIHYYIGVGMNIRTMLFKVLNENKNSLFKLSFLFTLQLKSIIRSGGVKK